MTPHTKKQGMFIYRIGKILYKYMVEEVTLDHTLDKTNVI